MFTIDKASGLPIYLQIKHQVIYDMALDRLAPGAALPSIRQLAASLGVTTATIRHAYDALEAEGLVVSRPGKGVLVAELSADARAQVSLRQMALGDLFRSAFERARAMGYSPQEIRAAVARSLARTDHPRVALVSAEPEFVEYYTPLLAEALRNLRVRVVGVLLRDLRERGPAALGDGDPPHCVAALVRSYPDVRDLLRGTALPVLGLAVEVAPETQAELLSLSSTTRAVLVAERINLIGMTHLIEQYWVPDHELAHVALESRELAAALGAAEVIIHSLRARRTVVRVVPPERRLIELHHVLNPVSLTRLREVITEQTRTEDPARVARPA